MRSYPATITRTDDGWSITATTAKGRAVAAHTRRLAAADTALAEAIAAAENIGVDDVTVESRVLIDGVDATSEAASVADLKQLAQEVPATAAAYARHTAQRWRAAGVPLRDIGTLLGGISHQRVAVMCASINDQDEFADLLATPAAQHVLDTLSKMSRTKR